VTVYVSMLRGVNVGGSSRLKSDALRRAYEALGFKDVRTLLQSGNVLFRSGLQDRGAIARRIKQELERELGLRIEVVLRTLAEFAATVERGPVLSPKADPAKLLVMFLAELVKWHKGPEMLELRGPEVYLYYPEGVGRSKLSGAVLEDRLGVSGTARNWNTLTKMLEVGRALDKADGRA
jgi:uncharacterized protein (DUF1697 family)